MNARRRTRWWIVLIPVAIGVLALIAVLAAEPIVRGVVTAKVAEQVRTALHLDADHEVDVEFSGSAVDALVRQRFLSLSISSPDVAIGDLVGDVRVDASAVTFAGDMGGAFAYITVTPATVKDLLLERLRPIVADVSVLDERFTLDVDGAHLLVGTGVRVLGSTVPMQIALNVQASEDGRGLFVSPVELRLDGVTLTAQQVIDTFGGHLAAVFDGWTVCVADRLPAGITLFTVGMQPDTVEITLVVDGRFLSEEALRQNGTCQ